MCTGSGTVGNRSRGPWSHGRGARGAKGWCRIVLYPLQLAVVVFFSSFPFFQSRKENESSVPRADRGAPNGRANRKGDRGGRARIMGMKRCSHGKEKRNCMQCSPCSHGKVKRSCAKFNPCPHCKRKDACAECNGCPHGKLKYTCKECKTARADPPSSKRVKREQPSSPEPKLEPNLEPGTEIKQELFDSQSEHDTGE